MPQDSDEPINFRSGNTTLKQEIKNAKEFSVIIICLDYTAGLYVVCRGYKEALRQYSCEISGSIHPGCSGRKNF